MTDIKTKTFDEQAVELDRQLKSLGWHLVALQYMGQPPVDIETESHYYILPRLRQARQCRGLAAEQQKVATLPSRLRLWSL